MGETSEATRAGTVFARLTAVPALLLACWLAVGLPLLMAGVFRPWPVLAAFVPVAALVSWFGLRAVPGGGGSWWPVAGVLAVAVAFGAVQLAMCAEQIVVRRDPASYFNFATWLTGHGRLPIPQMRWAFGGGDPDLSYGSPAFYQRGGVLVPQFMAGMPIIVSAAGWIGGPYAMLGVVPVIGALAVLSFGGLTARLIGPRWAPLGAAALALTWPLMVITRSIYSEAGALVLMLGGLCLAVDAVRTDRRLLALLGGLVLGLTALVRITGLSETLPALAVAGLLIALRRRTGPPLLAGLAVGVGAGVVEGYVMSRPYLHYESGSLIPLLYIAAAVLAGTAVMVVLVRRFGLPDFARLRLPDLAVPATFAVMAFFAARPMFQTVRRVPHRPEDRLNAIYIEALQKVQGLPIDPNRQYSELSLHWVAWYIGVPAVMLAAIGAALVLRDLVLRRRLDWALPYAVIAWCTVTTLWRPGITPDQPWASRRLIVVVIPGLLLFALWAVAWSTRWARRRGHGGPATAGVAAGVVLLVAPPAWTSAGPMFDPTEQGEVAQARSMCRAIGRNASVLIVERVTADRFSQLVRGMCGVPTARVTVRSGNTAPLEDVARNVTKVAATGRRPVILGANASDVLPYGQVKHVFHVASRRDASNLTYPPRGTWSLTMDVWMAEPVYGR